MPPFQSAQPTLRRVDRLLIESAGTADKRATEGGLVDVRGDVEQ